jgi:hypothetical protein
MRHAGHGPNSIFLIHFWGINKEFVGDDKFLHTVFLGFPQKQDLGRKLRGAHGDALSNSLLK